MVEEVDIYPSLIAMHFGADAVPAELEGESFLPLLTMDHGPSGPPGKQRVFSQYPHSLSFGAAVPSHGEHQNSSGTAPGSRIGGPGSQQRSPVFTFHRHWKSPTCGWLSS